MNKPPVLTVIAGRPASDRPFEETHRTKRTFGDAVADVLESFIGAVIAGLAIVACVWFTVSLVLSLER